LGTGETVAKHPDPTQRTLEALGIDPAVWRYVLHVAQGKFADILDETQERTNSLDKLFQISQLENAHSELGSREAPKTQIELRTARMREKKRGFEKEAAKLSEEEASLKRIEDQRKKKEEEISKLEQNRERLEDLVKKTEQPLNDLVKVQESIKEAHIASENATGQIKTTIAELEHLLPQSTCIQLQQLSSQQIAECILGLNTELGGATEEEGKFELAYQQSFQKAAGIQSQLNRTNEDYETLKRELQDVQDYLAGKAQQPNIVCDRCGTLLSTTAWTQHLEEQQVKLKKFVELAGECEGQLKKEKKQADEYRQLRDGARNKAKKLGSAIPLVKQLEQQRHIIETSHDPELEKTRTKLLSTLRALLSPDVAASDQEVLEQASSLTTQLKMLPTTQESLEALSSFDRDFLNPQRKRVEDAKKAGEDAQKLGAEILADEKRITMLETIRTALREIQPVMRRSFVQRITQSANDYLKRLYGEAELENFELTEDYQFIVTRAGYRRHARRLSGGQQVLASISFLMALSDVLSQLDFLILDEPTTHLDPNRRNELVNVLERLRRVPQLIIVDHHAELLEAADTRFQVTLNNEGQSQVVQVE
jgi:exonuclease SbcC